MVITIVLSALMSCATPGAPAAAGKDVMEKPQSESVYESEVNPFVRIDKEVRNLSAEDQRSIPELISSLDRIAENDSEKTRALYIWVTHNIAYDTDSYFQGIPGEPIMPGMLFG